MTPEEKDLLIKDLCARLPYGVNVLVSSSHITDPVRKKLNTNLLFGLQKSVLTIKPYLRPMSSMTEEEVKEFAALESIDVLGGDIKITCVELSVDSIDWLNKNHFDYRGLIPMGLALVAKENMYKTE